MKGVCRVSAILPLLLSGCGAETAVLAIGYIAPIGGDFNQDTDLSTPQLESNGKVINIQIGDGWDQFYDTRFEVAGTTNLDGLNVSCPQFTGMVTQRSITGFIPASGKVCFKGRFDNESTLVLSDGRRLLRNFPVNLSQGTWLNINNRSQRFKFDRVVGNTFSGCEVVKGVITPLVGEFIPSDISSGVTASIKNLVIQRGTTSEIYSGVFEGASGIRLLRQGQEILLQRDTIEVACL